MDKPNSLSQYIFEKPLYEHFSLTDDNYRLLLDILGQEPEYYETIDAYCIHCQKERTFILMKDYRMEEPKDYRNSIVEGRITYFSLNYVCSKNLNHTLIMVFHINKEDIIKVGQYPSKADMEILSVKKYNKVLEEEKIKELTRAIGLYSHGIGIGSFVYLRRIFEYLVEKAHETALLEDEKFDDEKYQNLRFIDKIKMLSKYLTNALVKNKSIYSIISKGIHELSEEECLRYFETIKTAIELILDEKVSEREKENKLRLITKEIGKIKGDLK